MPPQEEEEEEEGKEEKEDKQEKKEQDEEKVPAPKRRRKTKANRIAEAMEKDEEEREPKGVVYLGHIPHGFCEPEMKTYFSQFGEVTRFRLSRSKKTGGSKGYGFIEFRQESVAKIVAQTMNKYLISDKSLVCEFLPKEKCHPKMFKSWRVVREDKRIERRDKERENQNDRPTVEVNGQVVPQLTEKQARRQFSSKRKLKDRLKLLDIDYDINEVLSGAEEAEAEAQELEPQEPEPEESQGKKRPKKKRRSAKAA
ncbi:unnamed protein product [Effrenium voratum]|uniref:RRM domain-containing protein n=1 Tax=Effrenium voratum TaxID=2562239 RepID=A0AA36JJH2_9DINO|nr:unnamed protein product [Effrenium voratum]